VSLDYRGVVAGSKQLNWRRVWLRIRMKGQNGAVLAPVVTTAIGSHRAGITGDRFQRRTLTKRPSDRERSMSLAVVLLLACRDVAGGNQAAQTERTAR
jgi:hypothetical protein